MLYIEKEICPQEIAQEIAEKICKNQDVWDAISEEPSPSETKTLRKTFFGSLNSSQIREALLREQHGLCAYCMAQIDNSSATIIEHWYPLSMSKRLSMDYGNWLATCDGGQELRKIAQENGEKKKPACCDNKKENKIAQLSPLNREQMSKIVYNEDGLISYIDDEYPDNAKRICLEIDQIYGLNGTLSQNGRPSENGGYDTATGVVKGRVDAYRAINERIEPIREGILSGDLSAEDARILVEETIEGLTPTGAWQRFVGVQLYALKLFLEREIP